MALADLIAGLGGGPSGNGLIPADDPVFQTPNISDIPTVKKNPFGLGWNVQDILGGIGDALSVGAGGEANYLNRLNNERFGNAIDVFQGDPAAGLKMMAQAAGPKAATDYFQQFMAAQSNAERNRINAGKAAVEAQSAQDERDANTFNRIAGILRTGNAGNWAQVVDFAKRYAESRGFDTSGLNIPDTFTEGYADSLTRSGLSPKDYGQLEDTKAYRDATLELNRDKALAQTILQGRGQNARTAMAEAGRDRRAAQAEAGRNARAISAQKGTDRRSVQRAVDSTVNSVIKANPGAMVQKNYGTGQVRYSTDGGKTWNMAR